MSLPKPYIIEGFLCSRLVISKLFFVLIGRWHAGRKDRTERWIENLFFDDKWHEAATVTREAEHVLMVRRATLPLSPSSSSPVFSSPEREGRGVVTKISTIVNPDSRSHWRNKATDHQRSSSVGAGFFLGEANILFLNCFVSCFFFFFLFRKSAKHFFCLLLSKLLM